jgi:transcriptional regulator with XRE-family HTH domain
MPPLDEHGTYPALEAIRVSVARTFIRRRRAAKMTQAALAKRAGVRLTTLQRLEAAEHIPGEPSLLKLEAALKGATKQKQPHHG